jgi:hypothetical protein
MDFSLSARLCDRLYVGALLPLIFFAEPRREPLHLGLLLFIALSF